MNNFYNSGSDTDRGTLSNLKFLINRKNVTAAAAKSVKNEYHAVSDFFDLATDAYIVSLVMTELKIQKLDETSSLVPVEMSSATQEDKRQFLENFISRIVDGQVMNYFSQVVDQLQDQCPISFETSGDGVYEYATNFVRFALLRRINLMATRAGDGNRIMRHWRFAFLVYSANHNTNYQLEAFLLTASVKALLTPRMSHQLVWNRLVVLFW